jgi:hypothetical protein
MLYAVGNAGMCAQTIALGIMKDAPARQGRTLEVLGLPENP